MGEKRGANGELQTAADAWRLVLRLGRARRDPRATAEQKKRWATAMIRASEWAAARQAAEQQARQRGTSQRGKKRPAS